MKTNSKIGLAVVALLIVGLLVYAFWPKQEEVIEEVTEDGNEVVTTSETTLVDETTTANISTGRIIVSTSILGKEEQKAANVAKVQVGKENQHITYQALVS